MNVIVPEGMRLAPVKDDDHEWLVSLHNDPEVLRNITNPQPVTLEQHLAWWEKVRHDPKELRLIFVHDGCKVGFTKFYQIDRTNQNCVLGADIRAMFRGQGYAKFMWALMLNKCFYELGMHRVSLTTAAYNVVGQRVYRGLGFKDEGRLVQSLYRDGTFHDQICMYMLRDQWVKP